MDMLSRCYCAYYMYRHENENLGDFVLIFLSRAVSSTRRTFDVLAVKMNYASTILQNISNSDENRYFPKIMQAYHSIYLLNFVSKCMASLVSPRSIEVYTINSSVNPRSCAYQMF